MDSITQIALGATIGMAFREQLGTRAVIYGAALGMLPDLDTVAGFFGQWVSLKYHRGITHSLIILAVLAPLAGWACWKLSGGRGTFLLWALLAFLALFTHPLLDLFTSYGTQIFAPITSKRYALDAIAIIDPLYTVPLLLAVAVTFLPWFSPEVRKYFAYGALIFSTAYLFFGLYENSRAAGIAKEQFKKLGIETAEIRATPQMFTIFYWRIMAKCPDGSFEVANLSTSKTMEMKPKRLTTTDNEYVRKALDSANGEIMLEFSRGWYVASYSEDAAGPKVVISDLRYGLPSDPATFLFSTEFRFDASGEPKSVRFERSFGDLSIRDEIKIIWDNVF